MFAVAERTFLTHCPLAVFSLDLSFHDSDDIGCTAVGEFSNKEIDRHPIEVFYTFFSQRADFAEGVSGMDK